MAKVSHLPAEARWAAASVVAFTVAVVARGAGLPSWATALAFTTCYVCGGWEPGLAGVRELLDRRLDVDLLMVVAAVAAAAIGQATDGGLLIVIFATSGALEAVATARTAESVRALLEVAPDRATVVGGDGIERSVPAADLVVGDVVLVRPGERVGADGVVVDGGSEVDQATVTGESLPVVKAEGDTVYAGTTNGAGVLWVRVTHRAAESVVARIVAMVEEASATKATAQLLVERVEQRYSVGMVAVTVGLLTVPLLAGDPFRATLLRAMTFMIVASPCGIVLATMPPLLSAIANAGRHGVLVKSAVVMERLGTTTKVAFDKTGTLTEGRPAVTAVLALAATDLDEAQLLALAGAAERSSEHPIGRAVATAAAASARVGPGGDVEAFRALPGRGVEAMVGGRRVEVRRPVGAEAAAHDELAQLEAGGHTAVVVTVDSEAVGVLGLTDPVRAGAGEAVARLAQLTGPPVMLTGDNPTAAATIAGRVGIVDVRAGLLPAGKVAAVEELEASGDRVLVVGDGINDAPAMAAAHLGLAMGLAGSDLTLDTADAVTVRDDLASVASLILLSRRARRLVVENLVFAGTVLVALVVWDLAGHLPLPLGVAGHEGSTVVIGLNGLRLLGPSAWSGRLGEA